MEMGMTEVEQAMSRLLEIPGYVPYHERAFGSENPVTVENATRAVAA